MVQEVGNFKILNLPLHEIRVGPFGEFISVKSRKLGPELAYQQQKWAYLPIPDIFLLSGIHGEVVGCGLTRPI